MGYEGHEGMMYADGDMMGSDDGMHHDMGDSYGHEGSPGQYEVRIHLIWPYTQLELIGRCEL
jgi:hypothetical protein